MPLSQLPVEIVCDIIALVVYHGALLDAVRLRAVNHMFEREVMRCFAKGVLDIVRDIRSMNNAFKLRLLRELTGPGNGPRNNYSSFVQAVIDYLHEYSQSTEPGNATFADREFWREEVCLFMASCKATCRCLKRGGKWQNNTEEDVKCTAFFVAIARQHQNLEAAMIRDGCRAFTWCPHLKNTALEFACEGAFWESVGRLIFASKEETKEHLQSKMWSNALRTVTQSGKLDLLETFFEPEFDDVFGKEKMETTFVDAAVAGQWKTVSWLQTRCVMPKPDLVIMAAARQGNDKVVREMLKDAVARCTSINYGLVLLAAVERGHVDLARFLLDSGGEEVLRRYQNIPHEREHAARAFAYGGSPELLCLVRTRGIDLQHEVATLVTAVQYGHRALVEFALDSHFDNYSQKPEKLRSLLFLLAVRQGHVAMVECLLHRLAIDLVACEEAESATTFGTTPLTMAVDTANPALAEYLLSLGASTLRVLETDFSGRVRQNRLIGFRCLRYTLGEHWSKRFDFAPSGFSQRRRDEALAVIQRRRPLGSSCRSDSGRGIQ